MKLSAIISTLLLIFCYFVSPCSAIGPYTNNGDTIYDQATGLTWMQQTADIGEVNWQTALSYCEGLELSGYFDWRVPNIRELKSLVNHKASLNAVLDSVFQYETAYAHCYYWSSTTNTTGDTTDARVVCFGNGVPDLRDKTAEDEKSYVRCVRGGVDGPKIQIDINPETDMVSSGTEDFTFTVTVTNTGESDLINIPITTEHATIFSSPVWKCIEEGASENAVCTLNTPSATGATFSANIPAGGYITIEGTGDIAAIPVAITVTAPGAVKTVIRGSDPPADLPGTQNVELCSSKGCCKNNEECSASILGIDQSKDTIVLTHGLQPAGCERKKLWTAFEVSSDNPAPAGYLLNGKYNGDINVLQYFWEGACHEHGVFNVPTHNAYENGRKNVYHAGERLAYLLLQSLSVTYSEKIHFIGHSLGTGVTAYAANIFLRQVPNVLDAQVTLLDYPSTERVGKILDGKKFEDDEDWGKIYGFDKNFFASTLPSNIHRPGFKLRVDNYFAEQKKYLDGTRSFGVGTAINGRLFYNYEELEDPGLIGKLFLANEGTLGYVTANDHSGVHQWYRWTIQPNENENFNGNQVCSSEWNKLPLILMNTSTTPDSYGVITDECCLLCKCEELGEKHQSLSPCDGGWYHSIIDGGTFPGPNGKEANATSSFNIKPSNVTTYDCVFGGMDGSYICREDGPSQSPSMKAEVSLPESLNPPEEPELSYAELNINAPEFVRYISFDYTFNNVGDGDYVYLFAEGKSIWLMSGNDAQQGETQSSGQIPLRMTAGANKLVVALYGVGEKNAEFEIKNLKFTTVFDTDGDGCADDEDDFPEDPSKCSEDDQSPWLLFLPAIIGGKGKPITEGTLIWNQGNWNTHNWN